MFANFIKQQADGPKRGSRRSKQNKINRHSPGAIQEKARSKALNRQLEARLAQSAMTADESAYIKEALDSLGAAVGQLGEEWCARPFGSMASTFRTRDSDVDVTCLCKDGLAADKVAGLISERLAPVFRKHPRFTVVEEVLHAKVPILKLVFDELLEIDLSCQNTMALQNTRLLRAYAMLDSRVRDFVIAVKLWSKGADVCGASRGRLSSYAFTLLAIYFLQVHEEVLLPCLPTDAFNEQAYLGQDDEKVVNEFRGWSKSCSLSTVDLLYRFFHFYHSEFVWGHEVVSVRMGDRGFTNMPVFGKLRGRHVQRFHVEDPFLLERNLHCVLGEFEEGQLQQAFAEAAYCFEGGFLPVGLEAAPVSHEPLDTGSVESGGQMLKNLLQQGQEIIKESLGGPESTTSDATASTTAVHSSCSSDGGSGDEALAGGFGPTKAVPGKSKGRCSSSLESVSTAASSTSRESSYSDTEGAMSALLASTVGAAVSPSRVQRWADVEVGSVEQGAIDLLAEAVQPEAEWAPAPSERTWWQNMISNEAGAPAGAQQPRVRTLQEIEAGMGAQPSMLTVQALEGMIGASGDPAKAEQRAEFSIEAIFNRPHASRSTKTIAARVSKACLAQLGKLQTKMSQEAPCEATPLG